MNNFADKLINAIKNKGNPCVVGLDYHEKLLPQFVFDEIKINPSPEGYRHAISGFFKLIIDTIAPIVPAVKPQISLLESMTWVGSQIFWDIVNYSKQKNLIVIADTKRSDISSSAEGYAKAYIDTQDGPDFVKGYDADAMTLNPFFGSDSIQPYLRACQTKGKGIFILVKTSNKSSVETQDIILKNTNEPIYMLYARMVEEIGSSLEGELGYSSVCAVVGATFPEQAKMIRRIMPKTIILVPGYGAQGATSKDVIWNFNNDGLGAIINASRSITYSFTNKDITKNNYIANVKENTLKMVNDIVNSIKG